MILPLEFLKFWFWITPIELFGFFTSLNSAFLQLFSLPLLIKTYFKPWKNEYREGLVGFSIGMGIFIKTFVIIADIFLLLFLILFEITFFIVLVTLPILLIFLYKNLILFFSSVIAIIVIFLIFKPKRRWINSVDGRSTVGIAKELLSRRDVLFLLKKAEIAKSEIQLIDLSREEVLKNAGGDSPLDIFKSYLLLTEDKTKLLFGKQLKVPDLENITQWAKSVFPQSTKPFRVGFWGEGIGESWVSGWTLETAKYMVDITSDAINKKPMVLGRDAEYKEVIEALTKKKSCLLVGEPGSGRESLVKTLAYESFVGHLKGNLYHQRFFHLLTDTLLAGAQNQGQLEERLENIIAEISHSGNIIIFIPNFENILGSSSFNIDLSGALIPYLDKGIIRIIGNITPTSYKRFVESKHTLNSIFEIIKFEEPDKNILLEMLLKKSPEIEKNNKVEISYRAVVAACNFANKYLQDRVVPGAAVTLLEDVANEVFLKGKNIVEEQDIIDKIEEKTKIAVGKPKEKEKELLLHLEGELHKRIIGQNEAIFEVSESLRRLRAGLGSSKKPISFLFLGPTGVGKTETAKALSDIYYGGENKMIRFDMSEYSTPESVNRFLGGTPDSKGITDKVCENPYSLVLLDEFEKASPKIFDLFLQVLDDGRLTDNAGKTVSFVDNIIIATSNAASEYIREEVTGGKAVGKDFQRNLLENLQQKGIFRPEFLNRFDAVVVFRPLTKEEMISVVRLMLNSLCKKLLEKDITASFDQNAIEKITQDGFDQEFGARPLQRFIQDNVEDLLAQKMLKEEIKRGDKVLVSASDANMITITVS
jgi:ATP-dependent Clp protease ATP-binding subunit ClpC